MTPTHEHVKSLSRTVFQTVLWFCLAAVLVFAVFSSALLYQSYEHGAETALIERTQSFATALDAAAETHEQKLAVLNQQFDSPTRITLIESDGNVLFDSEVTSDLPNHADRPEFQEAEADGEALVSRYSETLQSDTLYCAVRMDDGCTLRLAENRSSLFSFMTAVLFPIIALLLLVVFSVSFLSQALTRRILKPINALDFKHPLQNEIYEEMDPLLIRIDEQQEQLRSQNKELARADNLRREFSANVSHEMKTPLTVISGYAELLKNNMVAPEDRQRFAGLIYDESQVLRALIEDILTISRLEESNAARDDHPINVRGVADNVVARLLTLAREKNIALQVEGPDTLILGTETLFEQIIYNLVSNGIRYSQPGGAVRVKVGTDDTGHCVISVCDNGIGIDPKYQEKIFERFFRVDKSRSKETGGTGLGLAIVKHAVQYQGGTIEVRSALGEGTTFALYFPQPEARKRTLERRAELSDGQE